jgi:hypothetical protein
VMPCAGSLPVMVGQTCIDIRREPDVELGVPIRVSQNVDESLVSGHYPALAMQMPGHGPLKCSYSRRPIRHVAVSAS